MLVTQQEICLNTEQKRAARFGSKNSSNKFCSDPLLIIAGAGTGKTNTLAHRAAHLILNGVDAERILIMTFSRRAANELVERTKRIAYSLARKTKSLKSSSVINFNWIGTFHSVANKLLRQHSHQFGLTDNFTIIDRNDSADLINLVRHELKFDRSKKRFPQKMTCLNIYSRCVNSQSPLKKILDEDFPWCKEWQSELAELFSCYSKRKIEQVMLDYDDLLLYWFHLLDHPEVAMAIRQRFDHVLVDEYQDTNILQAGIITKAFPDGQGLAVVGDDAQSIYRFRSAEIGNILDFPNLFSSTAKVITLKTNYRSTQPILDLANQLLAESKQGYKKTLVSAQTTIHSKKTVHHQKPRLVSVEDDRQQANYIVQSVLSEREAGTALKQQAILFRNSHHSDRLEIELMRHDIPFVKYGGLKFLEASHVKDFICLIRWIDNPKHQLSAFRILNLLPGFGPSTAMKAFNYLQLHHFQFSSFKYFSAPRATGHFWEQLIELLSDAQIEGRNSDWPNQIGNIQKVFEPLLEESYEDYYVRQGDIEQLSLLAQQTPSRETFISELTLDPPVSSGDLGDKAHKDDDFLILSTIHSAKGQEWKNVYLLNVADGNFPNEYATDNPDALEEERRLLNVAITRAKQNLHLIQPLKYWVPEQPKYGDKHVYGAKSRFLTRPVLDCLDNHFYPPANQQTAEPSIKYDVMNDVQKKIQQMW